MLKRVKATILYATETGKSETFAQKLKKLLNLSFYVEIKCMDEYEFENLHKESLLILVTSTFGNGEPPDNGKVFSIISSFINIM
jgi:sulfite reductase alpha subunit-like flavoprotein